MSGRHPCGFWPGPALNWTVRTRRWSGISGPRRRPPIFGNHGWSWARLLYQREEWDGVLYAAGQALAVRERPRTYICEPEAWGSLPHDLRCQAFYHTGRPILALEEARRALACRRRTGGLPGKCGAVGAADAPYRSIYALLNGKAM